MTLFSDLGTLESAGLIRVAKVEPDLEYLFRHALVQDAAYASLLDSDRKRLHLAVGNAIESLYPERRKELAAILGYHFREAGEMSHALGYFFMAGDEALLAYANQEAEIQYRQALELVCCSEGDIAKLYANLGEALYRQSRLDESVQALRAGIDIYKSLGDADGIARLYARIGRVVWHAGDRPEGLRQCLEGLELVKDAPESWGKATLIHETARAYYFNGKSDKALPLCRQALELAGRLSAVDIQADALATLGILAGISPEESLEALRKSVELAETHGLLEVANRAHHNLGTMTRTWLSDNQVAMENFKRAAELGRLRGVVAEELMALLSYTGALFALGRFKEIEEKLIYIEELTGKISNPGPSLEAIKVIRAVLTGYRGDWKSAITVYRECLQKDCESNDLESMLNMSNELSWVLLELNRWEAYPAIDEVERLLEEAVRIVERDNSIDKIWVYPQMVVLRVRQGRLDEAHQWLEKSRQFYHDHPSTWSTLLQGVSEAELLTAEKKWSLALAVIEKVTKLQARLGFRVEWARSLLFWADIYIQRGEPADLERAQTLLREALVTCNELGVGYYPEIIQDRLEVVRSRTYTQTLEHDQMTKDLKKARRVQESMLPENVPELPGWEIAVALEPAHETSGDFYDFLQLPEGYLGLVIADVTDKGTGAALYMALSRSILRTYAQGFPTEPERTMASTNDRIIADTHGGLFITLFYGILNPKTGYLTYCSAGHHPAYLVREKDRSLNELGRTGIPLGAMEKASWSSASIEMEIGDCLVLYTDGMSDAQNASEEFYSLARLQEAIRKHRRKPAKKLRDALLAELRAWVGDTPQFDDITLMVIKRGKQETHI
jgi:serine phosphatase RsbU (regulator of sigma subunit)